ncbi:hypothetical protein [Aquisalimonas asiatica]|uniref:Uncharacterized protein n=1 Tax=Aquisalimonas asiatica TaxID=406100 RepID=A0A1H8QUK1_9GAMM|nr:hypothetical protein [Aquisalimonas asiatica]SEO57608.1 hypothetical protein SAMN04488052_101784 [Aquisalimonas asiatica]
MGEALTPPASSNGKLSETHQALFQELQHLASPWQGLLIYQMPWPGRAVSLAPQHLGELGAVLRQRAGPLRHLSESGLHSIVAAETAEAGYPACRIRRIPTAGHDAVLLILVSPDQDTPPPDETPFSTLEKRIAEAPTPPHPDRLALERAGLDVETGLPDHDGFCRVLQAMLSDLDADNQAVLLGVVNLASERDPRPSARVLNEVAHRLIRQLGQRSRVGRVGPSTLGAAVTAAPREGEEEMVRRVRGIIPYLPDTWTRPAIGGIQLRRSDLEQPGMRLQQAMDRTG